MKMRKNTKHREQNRLCFRTESQEVRPSTSLQDNLAAYRPYIDNFDLTEAEKLELVNAITIMAETILDAHFRVHRYQALYSGSITVDRSLEQSDGDGYENES
jgi:hypothetical protein